MGSLTLPSSGAVYVDANCVIYSIEKIRPFCGLLDDLWRAAARKQVVVVSSELCLLETLIKPVREREATLEKAFRSFLLDSREFRLLPIDRLVIERALRVRAETGLKTPDAIHAATAIEAQAALFLSNDAAFEHVVDLPVVVLSAAAGVGGKSRAVEPACQADPHTPEPLPMRQVRGRGWEVLIVERDTWLPCRTEEDARAIAAARVLEYEGLSRRRSGRSFAAELEKTAETMEKYRMGFGARFLRRMAEEAGGQAVNG